VWRKGGDVRWDLEDWKKIPLKQQIVEKKGKEKGNCDYFVHLLNSCLAY
jgi:hypothetical protein